MVLTRLFPLLLQWLSLAAFLALSQLSWAGVIVADQEIGKAKWSDRTALESKKFKVVKNIDSKLKGGRALHVEGLLIGNLTGSAELFYDANNTLIGARILSPKPKVMLKRLAKASRARLDADNRYTLGDLRLRIIPTEGQDLVYITSEAFDDQIIKSDKDAGNGGISWWAMALWFLGGSASLATSLVVGRIIWRNRTKLWSTRAVFADYLVAFIIAGTITYDYSEAKAGLVKLVHGLYIVGCSFLLVWSVRTVRHSGWVPRALVADLLWILPVTPFLLVPVVLRNAFKSIHYGGMTLLFGQLFALAYYGLQPGPTGTMLLLATLGLLGGGIARLYCSAFEYFNEENWHPAVCALLPSVFWPLHLIGFCVYVVFTTVVGALGLALYMIIPAILVWVIGAGTETEWLKTAAGCLPFLGLLPGVIGFFAMGTLPTGYSGLEFDAQSFNQSTGLPMIGAFDSGGNAYGTAGFDINPANGMQMFGGIGGFDTFGNTYGFDSNDPW